MPIPDFTFNHCRKLNMNTTEFPVQQNNPEGAARCDIDYLKQAVRELVPCGLNKTFMFQALDNLHAELRKRDAKICSLNAELLKQEKETNEQ